MPWFEATDDRWNPPIGPGFKGRTAPHLARRRGYNWLGADEAGGCRMGDVIAVAVTAVFFVTAFAMVRWFGRI
jgi:hypothetical protein